MAETYKRGVTMTDNEILIALITIKRGIYSKPIKAYIDSLILKIRKKPVHERYYHSAMSYHLVQESFTYGQKNPYSVAIADAVKTSVDVEV